MVTWPNGRFVEWSLGRMVTWPNGTLERMVSLAKWTHGRMPSMALVPRIRHFQEQRFQLGTWDPICY